MFPLYHIWHSCHKRNTGYLDIILLTIYNLLWNVSFSGMKTSLAMSPKNLSVSLPIFSTGSFVYVQWDPNSNYSYIMDHTLLLLLLSKNHAVINEFVELFEYTNSQSTYLLILFTGGPMRTLEAGTASLIQL